MTFTKRLGIDTPANWGSLWSTTFGAVLKNLELTSILLESLKSALLYGIERAHPDYAPVMTDALTEAMAYS